MFLSMGRVQRRRTGFELLPGKTIKQHSVNLI
jgi:hypothetical protein